MIGASLIGQVQEDGTIRIQKLCEDCDTPGDEDGDGFADCADLDCILRNRNREGFSSNKNQTKSFDTCEDYINASIRRDSITDSDMLRVTRRVNGGTIGIEKRTKLTQKIFKKLTNGC